MNNSKAFNIFCRKYEARAKPSYRMQRRIEPISYKPYDPYDQYADLHLHTYEVPSVEILMPEDRFKDLVELTEEIEDPQSEYNEFTNYAKMLGPGWIHRMQEIEYRTKKEAYLRESNPGVKKAYENYLMLLRLAGG